MKGISLDATAQLAQLLAEAGNGRGMSDASMQKVNLNLPTQLVKAIKAEALKLTGHRRRGFSDLVVILLRHGWEAYQAGEVEIELYPAVVEVGIAAVKK